MITSLIEAVKSVFKVSGHSDSAGVFRAGTQDQESVQNPSRLPWQIVLLVHFVAFGAIQFFISAWGITAGPPDLSQNQSSSDAVRFAYCVCAIFAGCYFFTWLIAASRKTHFRRFGLSVMACIGVAVLFGRNYTTHGWGTEPLLASQIAEVEGKPQKLEKSAGKSSRNKTPESESKPNPGELADVGGKSYSFESWMFILVFTVIGAFVFVERASRSSNSPSDGLVVRWVLGVSVASSLAASLGILGPIPFARPAWAGPFRGFLDIRLLSTTVLLITLVIESIRDVMKDAAEIERIKADILPGIASNPFLAGFRVIANVLGRAGKGLASCVSRMWKTILAWLSRDNLTALVAVSFTAVLIWLLLFLSSSLSVSSIALFTNSGVSAVWQSAATLFMVIVGTTCVVFLGRIWLYDWHDLDLVTQSLGVAAGWWMSELALSYLPRSLAKNPRAWDLGVFFWGMTTLILGATILSLLLRKNSRTP